MLAATSTDGQAKSDPSKLLARKAQDARGFLKEYKYE
jgi:hypothetical protein